MEDKLIKALEATGLPVYNLERPEGEKNCIVYNSKKKEIDSWDK